MDGKDHPLNESATRSARPAQAGRSSAPARGGSDSLVVRNLTKRFGSTVALEGVDLELPGGELICFLGPSGCGKTTLLRIIAGLERPSQGQVLLGGRDITGVPVHERNVGMVFQSFALFPHLSVAENVAYGLRIRGVGRRERLQRAEELLAMAQLDGLGNRDISQLSGGQRQRVAMARALALEPSLFLLDEPLSALDAKLRQAMQVELRQLQQRLRITTMIVTHDQEEAMTMADVVVVMGNNRVQQVGSPLEVYHRPMNRFVADFLGTNNFLPAVVSGRGEVTVLGQRLSAVVPDGVASGSELTLSIRPEKVRLLAEAPPAGGALPGTVTFVRDLGAAAETYLDVGGHQIIAAGTPPDGSGEEVWLELPPEAGTLLRE